MAIVASTIVREETQPSGHVWTVEDHTDSLGKHHRIEYLRSPLGDSTALLAVHTTRLWDDLVRAEMDRNLHLIIKGMTNLTFDYHTATNLAAFVREEYRNATKHNAIAIGAWLDANLTDTQLKNLFSLTTAQTTALRTKIHNAATIWASLQAEGGV